MGYAYAVSERRDILAMIPDDGVEIGSIGCGVGWAEGQLVERGRRVHGVDIAPEAIEAAKTRLTSARLVTPATPPSELFAPESLDGLILADVIEHLPSAWTA